MVVEYKDVTVWETPLLNSDFARVLEDDNFVPNGIMIQGWWNIKLTKATQLLTQELNGTQFRGNLCFTWGEGGSKILNFLKMITLFLTGS